MSEETRDNAAKCVDLARKKLAAGDVEGALRLCRKSISIYENKDALGLMRDIESAGSSSSNLKATPTPEEKAKPKKTPETPKQERSYTAEQIDLVKKVNKCDGTDYYAVLQLARDCTDSEVKKAYKKLALRLHPDKCGAPGAEEAFKRVSKAFQILSDDGKRRVYDSTGHDPDSKSMPSRGGFSSGGMGGQRFATDELSPEDLFNMFFAGGGGGFGNVRREFGGANPFKAQFMGPGGFTFSTGNFGRARQATPAQPVSSLARLLPFILLLMYYLVMWAFTTDYPDYSFTPTNRYDFKRSSRRGVPYYLSRAELGSNGVFKKFPHQENKSATESVIEILENAAREKDIPSTFRSFEKEVEEEYFGTLQNRCRHEINARRQNIHNASGFFGIGADEAAIRAAKNKSMPNCERLAKFGYTVQY